MASETSFLQSSAPNGAPAAPNHDDVISARVQRSSIAVIQMAPPAQGTSSSSSSTSAGKTLPGASSSSSAPKAPNGTQRKGGGGGAERAEKSSSKRKRHHCSVHGCTYNTPHSKDLARHMRKHTGEKPYKCDRCTKSFTRHDKLLMHIRTHEGHKPFACPRCDYSATDPSSLRKHVRTHDTARPYKCHMCPYASKSSSQLVVHIRRHTGDSPYPCTFSGCEAAFKTSSDLTRHFRLHTGVKPFKCHYCDYRSAVKSNVTLHMNVHTHPRKSSGKGRMGNPRESSIQQLEEEEEEEYDCLEATDTDDIRSKLLPFQYACRFCDFKADTIDLFTLHMKESHPSQTPSRKTGRQHPPKLAGPANFECPTCQAAFISENSLRCHLRQHGTVPNKPANVNPEIYSPTPCSSHRIQEELQPSIPDNYVHPINRNYEPEPLPPPPPAVPDSADHYSLHEMQRMPLVHSSVITENPSVIANHNHHHNNHNSRLPFPLPVPQPVQTGRITQHHHYDEETGHLYVITYNHIDADEEDDAQNPVNYVVGN